MNRSPLFAAPAIATLIAVGACAPVEGSSRADPALAGPAVKVVGEAKNCIRTQAIRQSRVRSDQVIDFEMIGGQVYRSTLPNRCPRLGFERGFSYATSINQLCKQDIIRVISPVAGQLDLGAGCGLGEFVPVEYITSDE
ncbi:hypothetical protein EH31_16580 [Erythrobacter longus]|uniref:Lipoprotein n=1 Tax=Erythrobacter longus TaxID=1044 RepID=A0A074M9T3_ERYLO|nr:hypothetical protein [Erythrobacter longus]KEO88573.1 hypothetical protein EH31_16580 [Erythrobacter longus]